MSYSVGGSKSLTEKLEHWIVLDLMQIGVYAYFGYVAYNNLGYTQKDILTFSTNSTIIAVQLAVALILVNVAFLLHDKTFGSKHS